MSIINEYRIFDNLPADLRDKIKWYHVFISELKTTMAEYSGRDYKPFAFIGTHDDHVYMYGKNRMASFVLGHNKPVDKWTEVPELTGQNIEDLHRGVIHFVAKNKRGQVFAWGSNNYGQLGMAKSYGLYKPVKIDYFDDKQIIVISCGVCHALALSHDGQLFAWGWNYKGQVGCAQNEQVEPVDDIVATPIQPFLNQDVRFKFVHAYFYCSYAITTDGHVYVWGDNSNKQLGVAGQDQYYVPKIMMLNNIKNISSSLELTFFITEQGDVYRCGSHADIDQEELKTHRSSNKTDYDDLIKITKFVEVNLELIESDQGYIEAHNNKFLCEHGVFIYQHHKNGFQKSKYLNLVDHYLHEFQSTPKTVHIDLDGFLKTKEYSYSNGYIVGKFQVVYENDKLLKQFTKIKQIGYGSFGKVYLVRDNDSGRKFALKKIWIEIYNKSKIKIQLFLRLIEKFIISL